MGRTEYLTRLGLGLSAYRSADYDLTARLQRQYGSQQYDNKGRPVNVATEKLNAELRHAQNEVLELVKVVERTNHTTEAKHKPLEATRRAHLYRTVDHVCSFMTIVLAWYPETVLQRYMLGLYDTRLPLMHILHQDCLAFRRGGCVALADTLLSGLPLFVVYALLSMSTRTTLDEFRPRRPRDTVTQALLLLLDVTAEACLLPMSQFLTMQRLAVIRPGTFVSAAACLIGYYRLWYKRFVQLDAMAWSILITVPTLLSITSMHSRLFQSKQPMPWHYAKFLFSCNTYPTRMRSMENAEASRHLSINGRTVNRTTFPYAQHGSESQGVQTVKQSLPISHLLLLGAPLWEALLQLALRFIALQCTFRTFHHIVLGPDMLNTAVSETFAMPIHHYQHANISTIACLRTMSKIGLALGLKWIMDATSLSTRYAVHTYICPPYP